MNSYQLSNGQVVVSPGGRIVTDSGPGHLTSPAQALGSLTQYVNTPPPYTPTANNTTLQYGVGTSADYVSATTANYGRVASIDNGYGQGMLASSANAFNTPMTSYVNSGHCGQGGAMASSVSVSSPVMPSHHVMTSPNTGCGPLGSTTVSLPKEVVTSPGHGCGYGGCGISIGENPYGPLPSLGGKILRPTMVTSQSGDYGPLYPSLRHMQHMQPFDLKIKDGWYRPPGTKRDPGSILGWLHVAIGFAMIIVQAVEFGLHRSKLILPYGAGFWTGLIILLTGVIGVAYARSRKRSWLQAFVAMTVISCLANLALLTITTMHLSHDNMALKPHCMGSPPTDQDKAYFENFRILHGLLGSLGLLEIILTTWTLCYGSTVLCHIRPKNKQPNKPAWYYMVPYSWDTPSVTGIRQVCCGVPAIVVGIVTLVLKFDHWSVGSFTAYNVGAGIWGGVIFITAGIFGIIWYGRREKCLKQTYLFVTLFCALVAGVLVLIFAILSLITDNNLLVPAIQASCPPDAGIIWQVMGRRALHSGLVALCTVEIVVAVWAVAYTCMVYGDIEPDDVDANGNVTGGAWLGMGPMHPPHHGNVQLQGPRHPPHHGNLQGQCGTTCASWQHFN